MLKYKVVDKRGSLVKEEEELAAPKGIFHIGRLTAQKGWQGDLVLEDTYVSSKHCTISRGDSGQFVIKDQSSNGTFLNGVLIGKGKTRELSIGDLISLGDKRKNGIRHQFEFMTTAKENIPLKKRTALEFMSSNKKPNDEFLQREKKLRTDFEENELRIKQGYEHRIRELEKEVQGARDELATQRANMMAIIKTHVENLEKAESQVKQLETLKNQAEMDKLDAENQMKKQKLECDMQVTEANCKTEKIVAEKNAIVTERDEASNKLECMSLRIKALQDSIQTVEENARKTAEFKCVDKIKEANSKLQYFREQNGYAKGLHENAHVGHKKRWGALKDQFLKLIKLHECEEEEEFNARAQELEIRCSQDVEDSNNQFAQEEMNLDTDDECGETTQVAENEDEVDERNPLSPVPEVGSQERAQQNDNHRGNCENSNPVELDEENDRMEGSKSPEKPPETQFNKNARERCQSDSSETSSSQKVTVNGQDGGDSGNEYTSTERSYFA